LLAGVESMFGAAGVAWTWDILRANDRTDPPGTSINNKVIPAVWPEDKEITPVIGYQ